MSRFITLFPSWGRERRHAPLVPMKASGGLVANGHVEAMTSQEESQAVPEQEQPQANNLSPVEEQQFSLAIKPKGTPLFKLSALYKSRLRFCIFLHFLLMLVMCCKLSEDILDRLDIFILELEELFIPKSLPWEYLWSASILFAIVGLRGVSRNRLSSLNSYAAGTVVLGICPLIGAAVYFFRDVSEYVTHRDEAEVEKWQNFPVAVWWYIFITVALQVHLFSLYFAAKLIKLWRVRMKHF